MRGAESNALLLGGVHWNPVAERTSAGSCTSLYIDGLDRSWSVTAVTEDCLLSVNPVVQSHSQV